MDADQEFEAEAAAPPTGDRLALLTEVAREALALRGQVERAEAELKAAKAALLTVVQQRLPDIMAQEDVSEITVDGFKLTRSQFVSGSLPKDEPQRTAAINWLEQNDGGGLIKTAITVPFGRTEHNSALSLSSELRDRGFPATCESGVHTQTLHAFARERMKDGQPLDLDALNLFVGEVVKIKEVGK